MGRKRLVILGAGGHGLATIDLLYSLPEFETVGFLDSNPALHGQIVHGYEVFGGPQYLSILAAGAHIDGAVIAVGDNTARSQLAEFVRSVGVGMPNLVHPSASVSTLARLGEGVYIAHNVVVGPSVEVGDNVIINTSSVISHRTKLGNYANIAPGVKLSGSVVVGERAFVGVGASVIQGRTIGRSAVVGAGAVVVRDVPDWSVAVGVPARIIKLVPSDVVEQVAASTS